MIRSFFLIVMIVGSFGLFPAEVFAVTSSGGPVLRGGWSDLPEASLNARTAIVMDSKTGKILYTKNADLIWPAASLTKVMTSVIFLEQKPQFSKVVSLLADDEVGGGRLQVVKGTKLRTQDLIYCALVGSANNTATAMMRTSGLVRETFIDQMNVRASVLGMKSTRYVEASGIDPENVTTASDMAHLTRYAFSNPTIRRAAQTGEYRFTTVAPAVTKRIKNTNALLLDTKNDLWILGGKTGYLDESKYNLAIRVQTMQKNKDIIVVVLGAPTKQVSFDETARLTKWAWENYAW